MPTQDPWQDVANEYKAGGGVPDPSLNKNSEDEDWKLFNTKENQSNTKLSNFHQSAKAFGEWMNPLPLLKTIGGLTLPAAILTGGEAPLQSLNEIGGQVLPWLGNAAPYGKEHPALNVLHGLPFVGPPGAQIASEVQQGKYPEAGGHFAAIPAQLLLGKLFGDIVANPEARMPMPPMPSAGTIISAIRHPIKTAVISGIKSLLGEEPESVKAPPAPKPPPSPVWTSSTTGVGTSAPSTPTIATPPGLPPAAQGIPMDLLDDISKGLTGNAKAKFMKLDDPQMTEGVIKAARDVLSKEMESGLQRAIHLTEKSGIPDVKIARPPNEIPDMEKGPPATEAVTEGQKAAQNITAGNKLAADIAGLKSQSKNVAFAKYLIDEAKLTPEQVESALPNSEIAKHFPAVSRIRMASGEIKQPMKTPETSGHLGKDWPTLRLQLANQMREELAQRSGGSYYNK